MDLNNLIHNLAHTNLKINVSINFFRFQIFNTHLLNLNRIFKTHFHFVNFFSDGGMAWHRME